jgi:uncharacterized membrane protein (DUF2068 family)
MMRFSWRREPRTSRHNGWLALIALFKLCQALLFAAIGVGALNLLGKDVGDVLTQLAHMFHFNPESRLVDFVIAQADRLDDNLLRRIGAVVFLYAALDLLEGIGLYLEKVWAEYLTLLITASFLPFELYEFYRRVTWLRSAVFLVNILVFLYLLWMVWTRRKSLRASQKAI